MCYYNYYMSLWVHMILSYYSASWESCHRNRRETQKSLVTSATTFASNFAKSITKYLKSISNISKFIQMNSKFTARYCKSAIQWYTMYAWICMDLLRTFKHPCHWSRLKLQSVLPTQLCCLQTHVQEEQAKHQASTELKMQNTLGPAVYKPGSRLCMRLTWCQVVWL